MSQCSRRWATYLAGLVTMMATVGAAWLVWHAEDGVRADDLPPPAAITIAPVTDPARIEGHHKCIDCHAREVQAWLASKHATRAFDLLRTDPRARGYAEKLQIRPSDIARKSLCVSCHATRQQNHDGAAAVISGVSCEQCHNASGGENGWLNRHAVYGPRGTRREDETAEHFAQRQAHCEQAGQLRSANLYQLVKRCFACHVVSNEALAAAGHQQGRQFEVMEKMLGEVRHNFFLDRDRNAEVATLWTDSLHSDGGRGAAGRATAGRGAAGRTAAGRKRVLFVVGQLVDLETSLRSLRTATDETEFAELMIDRIVDAFELIKEELLEGLEKTELPEIKRLVELVEPVYEKLDDDGFDPDDRDVYGATAEQVALVAREFAARDGNELAEIDDIDLLPSGPFPNVFQPGALREPGISP